MGKGKGMREGMEAVGLQSPGAARSTRGSSLGARTVPRLAGGERGSGCRVVPAGAAALLLLLPLRLRGVLSLPWGWGGRLFSIGEAFISVASCSYTLTELRPLALLGSLSAQLSGFQAALPLGLGWIAGVE